jgi:hypothetical protein
MSTGAVFFAHKKRITERNSHLAREASGSSISNGCQAKTERRRQLAGVGTRRRGNKATRQCHRIARNSVPRDCSSLGILFYGQPPTLLTFNSRKVIPLNCTLTAESTVNVNPYENNIYIYINAWMHSENSICEQVTRAELRIALI